MANRWGNNDLLYFLGVQNHSDWWLQSQNLKTLVPWKKTYDKPRQHIKSRDTTLLTRVHLVKVMVFPVSHVWMWKLDYKESQAPKNWCFWTAVLEKTLESPWTERRSNQSILKEISPGCSLEGLMLQLKCQYFGHMMWRADLFEKILMLGKIEGGRRREQQRMRWLDCITDSFNAHTVAVFQSPRSVWLFANP